MPIRTAPRRIVAVLAAAAVTTLAASAYAADDGPYTLALRHTPSAIEIEGAVPGEAARAAILAETSAAFPDLPLTIVLTERTDAPPHFVDAVLRSVGLLALLAEGEATVSDGRVDFTGAAFHGRAKSELETATGWPEGYDVGAAGVTAGPAGPTVAAAACEAAMRSASEAGSIAFEAGRANIRADSRRLVDRIAYEAARCPEALIAVAGHTDSDGTDEANYRLSLERARTVIDLLVADGIPGGRFTALGYGESRPLASNGSEAGKARNRRIEFVLRD